MSEKRSLSQMVQHGPTHEESLLRFFLGLLLWWRTWIFTVGIFVVFSGSVLAVQRFGPDAAPFLFLAGWLLREQIGDPLPIDGGDGGAE